MSKCANCAKGSMECSYMRDLTPVEGWTAQAVAYRTQLGKKTQPENSGTYEVIECPNFEPMRRVKQKRRKPDGGSCESTPCGYTRLDHEYAERKQKVLKGCSYGVSHFCDGTPNLSQGGNRSLPVEKREPCKYYRGGRCRSGRVREGQ